jgi:hypothetical protein
MMSSVAVVPFLMHSVKIKNIIFSIRIFFLLVLLREKVQLFYLLSCHIESSLVMTIGNGRKFFGIGLNFGSHFWRNFGI